METEMNAGEVPDEEAVSKKNRNTALTVRDKPTVLALESLQDMMQLAKWAAESELVPKDYRGKPHNCLIAFQMGAEVGLHPIAALQGIAVINGRGAFYGDTLFAICRASAAFAEEAYKEWTTGEFPDGDYTHHVQLGRRTRGGVNIQQFEFSIEDAKRAELWEKRGRGGQPTPWVNYPKRMLQFRARNFGLRDMFTDLLKGFPAVEELRDMEEAEWSEVPAGQQQGAEQPEEPASRTDALKQRLAKQKQQRAEVVETDARKRDVDPRTATAAKKAPESPVTDAKAQRADDADDPFAPQQDDAGPVEQPKTNGADLFAGDQPDDASQAVQQLGEMLERMDMDVDGFRKAAKVVTGREVQQRNHLKHEEVLQLMGVLAALHARAKDAGQIQDCLGFCQAFDLPLSTREDVDKAWKQYAAEASRS